MASSPLIRHALPLSFQPPQMESLLHTIYPSNGISATSSLLALGKEEEKQVNSNLQVANLSWVFLFDLGGTFCCLIITTFLRVIIKVQLLRLVLRVYKLIITCKSLIFHRDLVAYLQIRFSTFLAKKYNHNCNILHVCFVSLTCKFPKILTSIFDH